MQFPISFQQKKVLQYCTGFDSELTHAKYKNNPHDYSLMDPQINLYPSILMTAQVSDPLIAAL